VTLQRLRHSGSERCQFPRLHCCTNDAPAVDPLAQASEQEPDEATDPVQVPASTFAEASKDASKLAVPHGIGVTTGHCMAPSEQLAASPAGAS